MIQKINRPETKEMLRRYEFMINASKDWHTLINRDYVYEAANSSFCEAHNITREDIIGTSLSAMWGRRTFENILKTKLDRCFKGHEVNYQAWFDVPAIGLHYYDVTYYPYMALDADVTHAVVVTRNITQRKRADEARRKLERELQQARKIEALSTLAGGLAHEFNNALMVVAGHIELLQMTEPDNKAVTKFAKATNESIFRMSNLTQQLLAYAREGDVRPKAVHLSELVKSLLPRLKRGIHQQIQIETELMGQLPSINADNAQLEMILTSVVNNASEAIDRTGHIRIATSFKEVDHEFAADHPGLMPGPYVCLTIEDNGKGMDKDTLARIFDPFFTTKFQGRGLGMSAVYGIIKNHRGYIYVDSEPGKGTMVCILLPPEETPEHRVDMSKAELLISKPTILVIDDEEGVLITIQSLIEQLGYKVLKARSAKEAIKLTDTYDGTIDLALLDIKLPDMEGGALYPILKQARPGMKVIVCSGYSLDLGAKEILAAGAQGFLQKPFAFKTITAKLKEVLEV
ncbi:MAG: response regulator [Desulfobacteraceae bacterium]|jgi:two-component system, cell cycle sensor histidine kinase and response regulator CckA